MTTRMTDLLSPLRRERDATRFVGRLGAAANASVDVALPQNALTLDPTATLSRVEGPILLDDGVADRIEAQMTRTAWRQIASRLAIPLPYLDRIAEGFPDLTVNTVGTLASASTDTTLFRYFRVGDEWTLRAMLSSKYQAIDNFDVLRAVSAGMLDAGAGLEDAEVDVDLTDDRFRMRIAVPQVSLAIPDLLAGYRWPFSNRPDRPIHAPAEPGEVPPVLWAGFEVTNSETGHGAFSLADRAVVRICRNGLTRPVEFRRAHLGVALDQGVVDWSQQTRQRVLDLVASQVADAVRTFVSVDHLEQIVSPMRAAKQVDVDSPALAVEAVQRRCQITDAETQAVLDAFMRGGDSTVLGVGQAVTAAAQEVDSGDRQAELEAMFWTIVEAPREFVGAS